MDITLSDVNGDGSVYQLADADRQTLSQATLLTPNFNGGTDTVKWNKFFGLNDNSVYDPVAQANALQAQIDALTAQLAPLQATPEYKNSIAQIANPAQPVEAVN